MSATKCRRFAYGHCLPNISCIIKIQIGLTFLVLAYPSCPGEKAAKQVSVFQVDLVSLFLFVFFLHLLFQNRTFGDEWLVGFYRPDVLPATQPTV